MVKFLRDAAAKRERQVLAVFLAAFLVLSCMHFFSGYGDNGDFWRSVSFIFERPEGFSPQLEPGSDEWRRRYYDEWHNSWIVTERLSSNLFSFSIYKLYLLVQFGSSLVISGDASRYSMILGSVPSRLLLSLTFAALVIWVRRRQPAGAAWCFALAAAAVLLDVRWAAFLNSFYEEQMAVIFLPVLALSLLAFAERRSMASALATLACATLIGGAKTAYFYLPLLVLPFICPLLAPGRKRWGFFAAACVCQALAFTPVALGKYGGINAYHSIYFGALKVLPPEDRAALESIGNKPVVQACIGISAFEPKGLDCVQAANVRHADLLRLLATRPSVAVEMAGIALHEGRFGISGLGQGMRQAPSFFHAGIFNLYSSLLTRGFNLFALVLLAAAAGAALLRSRLGKAVDPLLLVGMLLGVFGASQYAMALGDGFYEIRKHLVIGNYALVLAFPFLATAFIAMAQRARSLEDGLPHVRT